jgi:hypothetical protein
MGYPAAVSHLNTADVHPLPFALFVGGPSSGTAQTKHPRCQHDILFLGLLRDPKFLQLFRQAGGVIPGQVSIRFPSIDPGLC